MSAVAPVPAAKPAEPAQTSVSAQQSAALQMAKNAQRARLKRLVRGLLLWVLLPTLIATVYYGFVVPDEYEASAVVVLRGGESDAARRGVMLSEYLSSRDALAELDESVGYSEHFASGSGSLGKAGADAGSEQRFAVYRAHTDVSVDGRNGVVRVKARAYGGEAARVFAQAMIDVGGHFLTSVESGAAQPFTVVAKPRAASDATYPHRGYAIITTFFACLGLFAIGSLLIAAVREHAHF
jgi:capsular polysaccharide transport system permease protein